jgi:predicted DNA binding protein
MYIIIKTVDNKDQVLNILYGTDSTPVSAWVLEYLEQQVQSLKLTPISENIKNISYNVKNIDGFNFELIKNYKKVNRGYVYNSSEKLNETLQKIKILQYNETHIESLNSVQFGTDLWANLNEEINNRVIKQLDKDTMFQVFQKIQNTIKRKRNWTNIEFTALVVDIVRDFKKELYSSIAKKMKRFGKKQNLYQYLTTVPEHNNVPENINWNGNCRSESESKNKLE